MMQGASFLIRKQGEAIGIENSPALLEEIVPLAEALKLETIHTRRFGASEDAGFLIERVQQHGGEAAYLILGADLAAPSPPSGVRLRRGCAGSRRRPARGLAAQPPRHLRRHR